MTMEAVDLYVLDLRTSGPIEGAYARFFDSNGTALLTVLTSDATGLIEALLPDGDLTVRLYKSGITFGAPVSLEILVGGPNEFTVYGQSVAPPVSTDSLLCVAYGFFKNAFAGPDAVNIHVIPKFQPAILNGALMLDTQHMHIQTDSTGYAEVPLVRGAKYDVMISGSRETTREITVPDLPNVNLPDLLFPVVARVVLDPITVSAGESVDVPVQVYSSDGNLLPGTATLDVSWNSEDTTVATVAALESVLRVTGVSSGTTTITATRLDSSIVVIPDPGISGQPVSVSVA